MDSQKSKVTAALLAALRRLREEKHLRQIDLAQKLGRPQSFVSKYESGERRLDFVEIKLICDSLSVPLQELIQRFEAELSGRNGGPGAT
jgi:transcriptional regulator with XRE-family HTH domain